MTNSGDERTFASSSAKIRNADKASLDSSVSDDRPPPETDLHYELYILRDAYEAGIARGD